MFIADAGTKRHDDYAGEAIKSTSSGFKHGFDCANTRPTNKRYYLHNLVSVVNILLTRAHVISKHKL